MIHKVTKNNMNKLNKLFENTTDTCILSCLQGHMGDAWVDNVDNPTCAKIVVGDFDFFAGDAEADGAIDLLKSIVRGHIYIMCSDDWIDKIEEVYPDITSYTRYSIIKDSTHLDIDRINELPKTLPQGYEVKRISKELAIDGGLNDLSDEFTSQFDSLDDFINRGIGYCVTYKGKIVSAATSYSIYDKGIEIEIVTDEKHRKKGLATNVAAKLIVYCLQNNLYPSWDADNLMSLGLAKKLGYKLDKPYKAHFFKE